MTRLGPALLPAGGAGAIPSADELIASVGHALALVLDDGGMQVGTTFSAVAMAAARRCESLREGAIGCAVIEAALGEG